MYRTGEKEIYIIIWLREYEYLTHKNLLKDPLGSNGFILHERSKK